MIITYAISHPSGETIHVVQRIKGDLANCRDTAATVLESRNDAVILDQLLGDHEGYTLVVRAADIQRILIREES